MTLRHAERLRMLRILNEIEEHLGVIC